MRPLIHPSYRSHWLVLGLCSVGSLFLGIVNSAYPPILPLIKEELGLTYTESGMFTTAYFIGYAIGQIPWGYMADRFGGGRAMAMSVLSTSIATTLSGTTTTGLEIVVWRLLAGLLGAGVFVPGVRVISEWFPPGRRGMAIGLFGAGTSVGGILAAVSSPLVAISYGWRWSIWLFSFLGLLSVPPMWMGLGVTAGGRNREGKRLGSMRSVISKGSFWILGLDQLVRLGMLYALTTWVPTYLFETQGYSLIMASMSITIINVAGILASPVGGLISDRVGEVSVIAASLAALIPCLYALATMRNLVVVWASVALLGWLVNSTRGPMFAILPKLFGVDMVGVSTGYQNTLASTGAVILPFIVGSLRDYAASFEVGWFSLMTFCGAGAIATLLLRGRDTEATGLNSKS